MPFAFDVQIVNIEDVNVHLIQSPALCVCI